MKKNLRNHTEYSGAEEWLRQTYPHLHAIWLQSFSNPDESSVMNLELTCMVCQIKPSSGLHYGVKMCEADKQFLKRTFHYQSVYPECGQGDATWCPPRPRGWCQSCRFRRCLSTPVTISMIRVGDKSLPIKLTKKQTPMYNITIQMPPQQQIKEEIDIDKELQPYVDLYQSVKVEPLPVTLSETVSSCNNSVSDLSDRAYQPLDLSVSRNRTETDNKSTISQSDFHYKHVLQNYDEPLNLSHLSSLTDQLEATDLSRPSSRDFIYRRTTSPILDASQALNKLTINSAILADALSRIQENLSMSNSLDNLSSVSDILSETVNS